MAKVEEKKMIVTLCGGYFIEVDELNHTLKQKYMGKDLNGNAKEQEKLIGYYPNVKSCVERVVRLLPLDFNNGEVVSMQEYAESAEKAFQAVKELDL